MVCVSNIYACVQGFSLAALPMYLYVFWSGREYSDMAHSAVDLVHSWNGDAGR